MTNTRLLGKVENGSTSNANLIFGGGFFFAGPNAAGSANLAGTLSFASGIHLGAIAVNPNNTSAFTFTINSTLIGGVDDTLQLTLLSEGAGPGAGTRNGRLIFAGDLSGFSGTLWVGTSVSGTNAASYYSVRSSSASTTLSLAVGTHNFRYDLAGLDTFFGAVQLGNTVLMPGTYDAAALNGIAGGSQFFGTGSITVVPEPSTYAAGILGLLAMAILVRRKRRNA